MSQVTSTPKEWGKMTVNELKEELQARGLAVSGKKSDLVARLIAAKAAEFTDDTDEPTLIPQGEDVSQLMEDMNEIVQEEIENTTTEDPAFVTAVDQSSNMVEKFEDAEGETTVLEQVKANASEEKDPAAVSKDQDDALSKADSLSVNLDQDIASLGDLEEKIQDETSDGKSLNKTEEGVLIDAVGEVDDDEFGAVVASMEEASDSKPAGKIGDTVGEVDDKEHAKQEKDDTKDDQKKDGKSKKTDEKQKQELPPLPSQPMNNWLIKQFATAKRFSCLYVRPLTGVDILCEAVVEWANRACYFCINHERNGKGVAVMNFITEKECKEAKESLAASLGEGVKVNHPTRDMAEEIKQAACYKAECPNLAMRTVILEDAPKGTTEDQVCLLFPGAISVSRPDANQLTYEWQKRKYSLPQTIGQIFLIEFGTPRLATKVIEEKPELEGHPCKLATLSDYQRNYRDHLAKIAAEERARRKEEADRLRREREKREAERVLGDKERIELCKSIKEIISKRSFVVKRNDLPWNDKLMQKEKLSRKLMDTVRLLDVDSDKRVNLGMTFPEPEKLMTRNTKKLFQRHPKLKKDSEEKQESRKSNKKSESKDSDPKDVTLKITVSTGGQAKREVEKSEKEKSVEEKPSEETVQEEAVKTEDAETKPTEIKQEQPAVKPEAEEGAEASVQKSAEDVEVIEIKDDIKEEVDMLEEVLGQVFKTGSDGSKRSKQSPKKDDKGKKDDKKDDKKDSHRKRSHSSRESEGLRHELSKLEEDKRGWWSVAQDRKNRYLERPEYEKSYKKFGKVMEVHLTDKKVFVRFNSRSAASSAIKELWGTNKNIQAPPVMGLWKKTAENSEFKVKDDRPRKSGRNDRGRDVGSGSRDRRGKQDIPSLLGGNVGPASQGNFQMNPNPMALQLQQQQMMMQQQLQQQQREQQFALLKMQSQQQQQQSQHNKFGSQQYMGDGLLGSHPQPLLPNEGSRTIGGRAQNSGSSIPSLFGATGVPPVRNKSPDRGFGSSRRRSISPQRGRSPPRKVLLTSNMEPKRSRFDDNYEPPYSSGDSHAFGQEPDAASSVADMLKGLSQVISSKMEEISRIAPTGEGLSDMMQSINTMQKSLLPEPTTGGGGGGFNRLGGSDTGNNYGNPREPRPLLSGSMGSSSGLGSSSHIGNRGGGGYGDGERMYSQFSEGSNHGSQMGRGSSQVLDYAHQSRKNMLDPSSF